MEKKKFIEGNELIASFIGETKPQYKISHTKDINGVFVKEGDIINADGYNSDIISEPIDVHCVEFDSEKGIFGSDVYSDFEPISSYNKIEVIAHCEQFMELYEIDGFGDKWSGNLGAALKDFEPLEYNSSWDLLMPVVEKIEKLDNGDSGRGYLVSIKSPSAVGYIDKADQFQMPVPCDSRTLGETRIESVWMAVVEFIKWYDENKK